MRDYGLDQVKIDKIHAALCNIKWPVKPIRYLGIYIGYDTQTCHNLNYEDKIRQIDEVLAQASKTKF